MKGYRLRISIMHSTIKCLLLLFLECTAVIYKKEFSLVGPFEGEHDVFNKWHFTGSAQLFTHHIRLTEAQPMKQGSIWSVNPCFSNDWEFQVQFQISGDEPHNFGNGIAIWYVKEPLHLGPVFGSKDHFSGIGVFIDTQTYSDQPHNHHHPYISAMVNNGSVSYGHDEDGTHMQIGSCQVTARNVGVLTAIAVSYIGGELTVYTDTDGSMQWVLCFKTPGVHLPTGYFFGVSASTGSSVDNHDVISITTLDMESPEQGTEDRRHVIPNAEFFQLPKAKPKLAEEREKPKGVSKPVEEQKEKETFEPKVEEKAKKQVSFTTKVIYVAGTVLIFILLVCWCMKYNTRRKERLRKRLY